MHFLVLVAWKYGSGVVLCILNLHIIPESWLEMIR